MAEATIYCPSCNRKVRIMEEQLGQVVQCPLCQTVFTSPVRQGSTVKPNATPLPVAPFPIPKPDNPSSSPTPIPEVEPVHSLEEQQPAWTPPDISAEGGPQIDIHRALIRPAVGLLVSGVLEVIVSLSSLRNTLDMGVEGVERTTQESEFLVNYHKVTGAPMWPPELIFGVNVLVALVFLIFGLGIATGAIQMLKVRNYSLAIVGSILAVVNFPCCWVFTLPLGIWSLAVLSLPEVRSAFE